MACAQAVERLWELLDNGLDHTERQAVDAHLAWCRRCCGELAFARELQRLLRSRTGGEIPGEVRDRLGRLIDGLDGLGGLPGDEAWA